MYFYQRVALCVVLGCLFGTQIGHSQQITVEKIPGKPVIFQPKFKNPKKRAIVWFQQQFLGDGKAYSRRAKEFAKWKRRELRTAMVKALKSLSEKSYQAVAKDIKNLQKAKTVTNLERHWIINGFSCDTTSDGVKELAKLKGVRAVFVRPARRSFKRALPKPATFAQGQAIKFIPGRYKHPWYTRYLLADQVWSKFDVTGKGTLNVVHDFNFVFSANLTNNLYRNPKEIPNNGKDDDGNGLIDDYHGYNFLLNAPNLTLQQVPPGAVVPRAMHGFLCANIICGSGSKGKPYEFGLAPEGRWTGVIAGDRIEAAVEWAIEQGTDTYSMSFSIPSLGEYRSHWRKVMEHASFCGVYFVSGAGNFAQSQKVPVQMRVPEDIPNAVFAATGVQRDFARTPFSSKGPVQWLTHFYKDGLVDKPEVCAFNMGLPFLKRDGTTLPTGANGNSFAGPMLAGSLALLLSADPDLLPWDARAILAATASDVSKKGYDHQTGHGLINCYRAVKEVLHRKAIRDGQNGQRFQGREKGDTLDITGLKKKLKRVLGVVRVQPNSQAAKVGVKAGDVFVRFDGKTITTRLSLIQARKAAANKKSATAVFSRNGQQREVQFSPGQLGIVPQEAFNEPVFR